MDDGVLDEQQAFYRARAPHYDDWWLGRGNYQRGEDRARRWHEQVVTIERALAEFGPRGDVLELAGGTGWWTLQLARTAGTLTVVDSSPEALELNRRRVSAAEGATTTTEVDYVVADLFSWEPARQFDVVFFSFWLSHVPRARFADFWALVRRSLRPGGRAFLVDNRHQPTPGVSGGDPYVVEYLPDLHRRRLEDGREFHVVKVTYGPDELAALLQADGWQPSIDATEWFLYGWAQPADPGVQ
ncbi:MAG: class I SAM-dependent methyltransferase [Actinomycetota bacterium]